MRIKLSLSLCFLVILFVLSTSSCDQTTDNKVNDETSQTGENLSYIHSATKKRNNNKNISAFFSIRPQTVSRKIWRAKQPIGMMKKHKPSYITIHHTSFARKKDMPIDQKMRNLQNFSQSQTEYASGKIKPIWPDVPYHFYIDYDGQIAEGRNIIYSGDTGTKYDPTGHIQIALEGNFEIEQPLPHQLKSLERLVHWLALLFHISPSEIKGHEAYTSTLCPGKNLKSMIPELREYIAGKLN